MLSSYRQLNGTQILHSFSGLLKNRLIFKIYDLEYTLISFCDNSQRNYRKWIDYDGQLFAIFFRIALNYVNTIRVWGFILQFLSPRNNIINNSIKLYIYWSCIFMEILLFFYLLQYFLRIEGWISNLQNYKQLKLIINIAIAKIPTARIMQDSLQNLSPKKKSVSPSAKDDKQRALFQHLKQKFITSLSKLVSSQTRQIGIQQIRQAIDKNRQPEHLRLFLSLMKNLKIQGTSSSTKQHQILVFSMLAEIFKENLIDPIDKPTPSRVKTCFRIVQILHAYFKDNSNTVQQACARVLIDLGKHVLGAQSQKPNLDTQTFINLLFTPLASILRSGVDKASQSTASVCINQQIQYWKAHFGIKKYQEMFDHVCSEMLSVSLRLNCQYHELFMALQTIIQVKGLDFFNVPTINNNSNVNSTTKLIQFVSKILGVINKINDKAPQEMASNFNSYMCKVNVCGILQKIGQLIRDKQDIKSKLDELDVAQCLQKATRNRVIQVQMAASRALRAWNGQLVSPQKNQRPGSTPKMGSKNNLMSLEQARNSKKRQRSNSKQEKLKLQRQLNYIKQDLDKLVKGGWGPHNRANNFVKKKTGGGGGYCSKMDDSASPQASRNKSHKQHIEQLRKFIKDSSKQHGSKDKFVFYEQNQKSNSKKKSISNANTNRQYDNFKDYLDNNFNDDYGVKMNKNTNNHKNSQVSQKDPTFNYGPNENYNLKYKQKAQGQQFDFMLEQQHGDQGVVIAPSPKNSQQKNYQNNPYAEQQYKVKFDTQDRQWLAQHKQALSKINSSNLSGILDEKQMSQLLKQQQQILNIQSKQQIKSNLTQKQQPYQKNKSRESNQGGFEKKIGRFGQMTFNSQAKDIKHNDKDLSQNNIKGPIRQQKQKIQAQKYKSQTAPFQTQPKNPEVTSKLNPVQQVKPIIKKPKKSLDDDYQIKQQKPLDMKQQKKVQMYAESANKKPQKINQSIKKQQQPPKKTSAQADYNQKQNEKSKKIIMAPITLKNIDKAQISLDGCSQKLSNSIPIVQIMNQSDFQGFGWNPYRKQTQMTPKHNQQITINKRKNSQNYQQLKYSDYNKDSLVLSLSKDQSRSKSPPKNPNSNLNQNRKNQFSLSPPPNPNTNKFNSFAQYNNDQLQQQILDQSKYEESLPYGNKLLNKPPPERQPPPTKPQSYPNLSPYISSSRQAQQRQNIQDYYKRSVQHGQQIDRTKAKSDLNRPYDQVASQIYQEMIKNPPKSHIGHRFDKVSHLTPQQSQQKFNQQQQIQNQQDQNQNITDIWQRVLQHVQNNQLNQAYTLTFKMDDPIYLLRLMLITQTPLKKLTPANTCKLWQKFLQIYQHRFIDNIFVQMFTSANKLNGGRGLNRSLSVQEINDTLVQLYELSGRTKGKLSFGAASLYNQIQQAINNRSQR